jgi:pimeloyl-ACP methyl ester carboxylesterase
MFIKQIGSGSENYFGIHGWGGDHATFSPLADQMPQGATLYCPDLPGYGGSPAPTAWSLDAIVEEISSAIAVLDLSRITLIGNCSGAILALLVTARLPAQIARLVLIDPFAFVPWYFKVFTNPAIGRYAYYSTFANPFGRWLTNASLRNRRSEASDLTGSFARVNHQTAFQYLKLLAALNDLEAFAGLRLPIEIVYGEKTFGAVKQSVARWQMLWPEARATRLAGAGHLPIEEAGAALSRIIFQMPESVVEASRLQPRSLR